MHPLGFGKPTLDWCAHHSYSSRQRQNRVRARCELRCVTLPGGQTLSAPGAQIYGLRSEEELLQLLLRQR